MREGRDGPGKQHLEGGLRAPTRRILHLGAGAREGFGNKNLGQTAGARKL